MEIIPQKVEVQGFSVCGLSQRTKNEDEGNPTTAKIPQLWSTFFASSDPQLTNQEPIYGVYSAYESDVTGYYQLTVGLETVQKKSNFSSISVKAGSYLVFKNQGEMPQTLIKTWQVVWQYFAAHPDQQRAYATDFEKYTGNNRCEIYIGIK